MNVLTVIRGGSCYWPSVQMVNFFEYPAGICKDFYLLGANRQFAQMCGLAEEQLVGLGMENIVHHDSIGELIGFLRAKALGDATSDARMFYLSNPNKDKIKAKLFVFPLKQITGSLVLLAEPIN